MKFTGKVLQTGDAGDNMTYARIKINNDINTVMFITYMNDLLGYRLLEDDNITVYGTSCGIYSYKSVGAGTISIPWIHADIIEMQKYKHCFTVNVGQCFIKRNREKRMKE